MFRLLPLQTPTDPSGLEHARVRSASDHKKAREYHKTTAVCLQYSTSPTANVLDTRHNTTTERSGIVSFMIPYFDRYRVFTPAIAMYHL